MVSQSVQLNATGTYVLSWWDQARDRVTGDPSTTALPYRVTVFDSSWTPIAGFVGSPTAAAAETTWSARHAVTLTLGAPDILHVAFAASPAGGAPGSVAIAGVQLELAAATGQPSGYIDTGSSGQVTAFQCALSAADLRAAFQRACDPDGTCYYDLQTPITIDTQSLSSNGMSLAGKLAAGNYNVRHVDVAINVAGAGVIDCSQTASQDCLGSAYLPYTLTHDGSNVGVLGFDNQYRTFDFGSAVIDHAKALTAERYITTPIASADQQLVNQVLKTELRGRPIDGTYHLRIYDSPALHFEQIDDIQVILNYHYWSRISAPQNSN
jgi:hypothetical protein